MYIYIYICIYIYIYIYIYIWAGNGGAPPPPPHGRSGAGGGRGREVAAPRAPPCAANQWNSIEKATVFDKSKHRLGSVTSTAGNRSRPIRETFVFSKKCPYSPWERTSGPPSLPKNMEFLVFHWKYKQLLIFKMEDTMGGGGPAYPRTRIIYTYIYIYMCLWHGDCLRV